jgi:microcystin degradation protein MlrC
MIKSVFAAAAASVLSAGAAVAGPYVNVENNAGFTGSDYNGALTEFHVGYEGDLGESAGYYVQAGPAIVSVDGEESETELSGKAGVGVDLTENINVYGEISFVTDEDDNGYGTKVGVKYSF